MHTMLIVTFAATSLFAAPAAAATTAQVAAPKAQTADGTATPASSADNKVCKLVDRPGTHAKQRFCLSSAEWRRLEDNQD